MDFLQHPHIVNLFLAAFLAILFLQSGLDKIFDWKGNLSWLVGHFSKSFLNKQVPVLLAVITITELSAGALSLIGAAEIIFSLKSTFAYYGALVSALSLLMLFFGQRIAKDYAGAATLVPYFILAIMAAMMLK